jgi:hypothetical protein
MVGTGTALIVEVDSLAGLEEEKAKRVCIR